MDPKLFLMNKLIKQGVDDVIIKLIISKNYQVKFYNSRIDVIKNFDSKTMSVFVAKGKKTIITGVKDLTKKGLEKKAKQIIKFLGFLPDRDYYGIANGPFKYRKKQGLVNKRAMNINKAREIVEDSINKAMNTGASRVAGVLEGGYVKEELISNHNVEASQEQTMTYLSIRSLIDDKDSNNLSSGHLTSVSRDLNGLKHNRISVESAEIALQGVKKERINPGKYDIIYYPLASSPIIESVGEFSSIFSIETQSSCFIKKINKKVGSEITTLIDDPTNNKNPGSELFDEEGVPTRKNTIIKDGVLKTYLHNTSTARKYGVRTTGNAGLIAPEPHSLLLKPQDSNLEEMIRTTKKGLIITNTWYLRFQSYIKGDFSIIPRDAIMIIKNGTIIGATGNIRINDNIIRMLRNIELISKKAKPTLGWETTKPHQIPIFKVKNVLITRPD